MPYLTRQMESDRVLPREIQIYLPPGWDDSGKTYPVIYMNDGQYLFIAENMFGGWALETTLDTLIENGTIPPVIVVGISSTEKRWQEYAPDRPAELYLSKKTRSTLASSGFYPEGDRYLMFVIEELMPLIEDRYPVAGTRETVFLAGSSMGAIISLYGLCEYPDIFGGACCMSTHWPIHSGVMVPYLENHLPQKGTAKIYFDLGSESIDREYVGFQNRVDSLMAEKGWHEGIDWLSPRFEGEHTARSWAGRIDVPLQFLLNPGVKISDRHSA